MDAHAVQLSRSAELRPWPLQVVTGLFGFSPTAIAGNNVAAYSGYGREHCERGCSKHDGFLARLRVRQKEETAFHVDMTPFEMEDFPQATAGEHQEPECRCDLRRKYNAPILHLREVLRR